MAGLVLFMSFTCPTDAIQFSVTHFSSHNVSHCYHIETKASCGDYQECARCGELFRCIQAVDRCDCTKINDYNECLANYHCHYCNLGAYAGRYCISKEVACG